MPAPLSNDDARHWSAGEKSKFDKLVVFSAWLLLASYDEDDDTLEDVAVSVIEEDDDSIWEKEQERVKLSTWRRWRHLENLSDVEFQEAVVGEILPALGRDFPEPSHPLALVRLALEDKPLPLLRREWNRAIELWDAGGEFNRDDARKELEVLSVECSLSKNPAVLPCHLQEFLVEALVPKPSESFLDLSARDGGVADRAAELGIRRFTLYERNLDLAVLAATRVRLYHACEVSVFHEYSLDAHKHESLYDCVVAAPPFGLKVVMPGDFSVPVRTHRSELLSLQHAIAALKPGGRAAVLMPNRFLFAAGDDRRVRKWLLRDHCVEAVVELPGSTFFRSDVKSSVLLIRRKPPREDVWFIRSDQFLEAVESNIPGENLVPDHEVLLTAIAARWNIGESDELRSKIARLENTAANAKYEMVEPAGIAWLTQNNRQLLALAHHFLNEPTRGALFPELVSLPTLEKRNWELLWKDGETENFDEWLNPVEEIPGARIATLGEVAKTIFVGVPYTSAKTEINIGYLIDGKGIGLMRVSDLPKSKSDTRVLGNAHKAFTDEATAGVAPSQILREGDLLVSRSGTVGKTGVFINHLNDDQKAVAANGIIVVRIGEKLQADFLARLLQSAPYQAALQAATTGSVIRHLRVETIRSLRVPILPKAEMLRLMEILHSGVSAETMLATLQSRQTYTVALRYLTDRAVVREFAARPADEPWQQTHRALREVLGELSEAEDDSALGDRDPFLNWTVAFVQAAKDLDEILGFPQGAEQFAALQIWRPRLRNSHFRKAYEEIRKLGPTKDQQDSHSLAQQLIRRCEQLYDRLIALSRGVAEALLAHIVVSATISPAIIAVGEVAEVQFSVVNRGLLPLRKFQATTTSFRSVTTTPLLSAGGTHVWTLVFTLNEVGRQTVNVTWKAHRLDDQSVSGNIELAVDVQSSRNTSLNPALGENPYIYARVLDGEDDRMFYGRAKVLDELAATLSRRGATTIRLIEGNRRIGKTSLLRHFVRHRMPQGWLAVFINFQDFEGDSGNQARAGIPTRAIFTGMARELVREVARSVPGLNIPELGVAPPPTELSFARYINRVGMLISEDEPFASFRVLIEMLRAAVYPRRLLLMFDEFDRVQEGIESGITSDQVPENIRHLFQTFNDLAGFFTGSRTIRRLRMDYWNVLFGMGEPLKLAGLEDNEAKELIELPVAGRLVFTDEAVRLITTLTARQPLLIQAMCMRIFDICKATSDRSVNATLVERVAEEKVADNEHFETLWSYIANDRQRLLVFFVEMMQARSEDATFDRLIDAGEAAGINFTQKSLKDALTDLLDLEVLHVTPQPSPANYRMEVPLFARWLRQNKDFAETRAAAKDDE